MPYIEYQCPRCVVCGKAETVTLEKEKFDRWQAGEHVQKVWPEMSAGDREVLISGTHDKCWDVLWKEE